MSDRTSTGPAPCTVLHTRPVSLLGASLMGMTAAGALTIMADPALPLTGEGWRSTYLGTCQTDMQLSSSQGKALVAVNLGHAGGAQWSENSVVGRTALTESTLEQCGLRGITDLQQVGPDASSSLAAQDYMGFSFRATDTAGFVKTFEYALSGPPDTVFVRGAQVYVPPNHPPVANAGPDRTEASGAVFVLAGSGTDPEGRNLTYQWRVVSGDARVSSPNVADAVLIIDPAPRGTPPKTVEIELAVTDNQGLTSTDTAIITVITPAANPPVAVAAAPRALRDQWSFGLTGGASYDPAHQNLRHLGQQGSGPPARIFYPSAENTSVSFPRLAIGAPPITMVFSLTVTDPDGLSDTATVSVTAYSAENRLPVARISSGSLVSVSVLRWTDRKVTILIAPRSAMRGGRSAGPRLSLTTRPSSSPVSQPLTCPPGQPAPTWSLS